VEDDYNGEDVGGEYSDYDFYSDPNNFESEKEFKEYWRDR
jgi:hypothetical protein